MEIQLSSGSFKAINDVVETIRLNYLLEYPIKNTKSEYMFMTFITFISYPLTIGLIIFLLPLAFGVVSFFITWNILGLIGLSTAESIVSGCGQGLFTAPIYYIFSNTTNELRRNAIKILAEKITMIYTRMYDLDYTDKPSFEDFSSSIPLVYHLAPIVVF